MEVRDRYTIRKKNERDGNVYSVILRTAEEADYLRKDDSEWIVEKQEKIEIYNFKQVAFTTKMNGAECLLTYKERLDGDFKSKTFTKSLDALAYIKSHKLAWYDLAVIVVREVVELNELIYS